MNDLVSLGDLSRAVKVAERFEALPAVIAGPGDVETVRAIMREAGDLFDRIESVRATLKAPILAAGKAIDAKAKTLTGPMQAYVESCKSMLKQYEVRRQREEMLQEMAAMEEGRATPDLSTAVVVAPVPKQAQVPTRTTYEAVVVNPELVPDQYWVIDQRLIDAAALGEKPVAIPGVEVRKHVSIVNR